MTRFPSALLFEDHDCTRIIVGSQLADAGYAVEAHTSPRAVMERPDLASYLSQVKIVWTDGSMPDMHGTEAAVTLRENGYDGLIILYSGDSPSSFLKYQRPDFIAGKWRGPIFDAIHAKPMALDELEGIISNLRSYAPVREAKTIYTTHK